MSRRFDLIVFDWDGTLMDSAAAIVVAIQLACRDLDMPEPDEAMARHVIGLGLEDALAKAVPDLPSARYGELAERYRYHYLSRDHELALFDGTAELVSGLHGEGRKLGIATGKSRRGLNRALAQSGLERWFHATRCADECHSKPNPDMLLELMHLFGIARERTLMVGDTTHDLQMARNAGVVSVAVGFGAHPAELLLAERPAAFAGSTAQLSEWLRLNG
ncbi:MAG: HAD-IA family hydrolase [Candidatus Methylophosphatis roskildensis]